MQPRRQLRRRRRPARGRRLHRPLSPPEDDATGGPHPRCDHPCGSPHLLHISPLRGDGVIHGTPTWAWSVVVGSDLYVRRYNGTGFRWYQAAMRQKAGLIRIAGTGHEVTFAPAASIVLDAVDDAYRTKYALSPYLRHMIQSGPRSTTVRVAPAAKISCSSVLAAEAGGEGAGAEPGAVVRVIATDPAAPLDLLAWRHLTGHIYLGPVPGNRPVFALQLASDALPTRTDASWHAAGT
ncbi:DUF2255 family protein [Streptomyces shenzhenensis]|uniref:DUF2255 family protein n=1 Tax=Streptomyces shenzhenensis TaxID=943815 RepID=UPI0033EFCCA3